MSVIVSCITNELSGRLKGPGRIFSTVVKADNRPISNKSLRILSNALRLVHNLLFSVAGPEKFAVVLSSIVNAR